MRYLGILTRRDGYRTPLGTLIPVDADALV